MILNIDRINKTYGKKVILTDINLVIDKPRLIALIAPNGSGKTTLLNIICNIEKASSGNVEVMDLPNNDVEIFDSLTFMQDNSILYYDLTGMDHIQLVQSLHFLNDNKVTDVLEKLKMTDYIHKKVKHYSLGMKQHLLFSLAILPSPKILLMDEPLNGLDPASIVRVRTILKELYKGGTTIIFSSHNLDQINKLTTDIYFMMNQKLVSISEISTKAIEKTFEVITKNAVEFSNSVEKKLRKIEIMTQYKCVIQCSSKEMEQLSLVMSDKILEYKEIGDSLEEIYFKLYEDYAYETTNI